MRDIVRLGIESMDVGAGEKGRMKPGDRRTDGKGQGEVEAQRQISTETEQPDDKSDRQANKERGGVKQTSAENYHICDIVSKGNPHCENLVT